MSAVILWTNIRRSAGLLAHPIMLLALAMQLILPAVTLGAMEHAGPIDQAHAQICGSLSIDAAGDKSDDRSRAPYDCGLCVVCQVGTHAGAVPLADQTGIHPPDGIYWLIVRQPARPAAPRGLPVFRAHARSPPVLS